MSDKGEVKKEPTCEFCDKRIDRHDDGVFIAFRLATVDKEGKDLLLLLKHRDCGPLKTCYCSECKNSSRFSGNSGVMPYDSYMGINSHKRSVFTNYCSHKCANKDSNYLREVYDEIQPEKHTITINGKSYIVLY